MSSRRGRGEGGLRKRKGKDGKRDLWEGTVTLPSRPGAKRQRRYVYAQTKAKTKAKLDRLLAQLEGDYYVDPNYTVANLLDDWVKAKQDGWRPHTQRIYEIYIREDLKPGIGHVRLMDLTKRICRDFLDEFQEEKSANSRNYVQTLLSVALKWACYTDKIGANPVEAIEKAKHQKRKPIIWEEEEVNAFMSSARAGGHRLYTLFDLILATGLRRGEVAGLQWNDIKGDHLKIQRQALNIGGKVQTGPPKSKAGERLVPIPRDTQQLLETHREEQTRQLGGNALYVFAFSLNEPLSPAAIYLSFKALVREAGVRACTLHDLRHWNISMKVRSPDFDIAAVANEAGHSSPDMTLGVYTQFVHRKRTAKSVKELMN
tara:strand:- start:761 stop:1879 length:1119 start_codon:yes stop_codon:yes gene_type:complete